MKRPTDRRSPAVAPPLDRCLTLLIVLLSICSPTGAAAAEPDLLHLPIGNPERKERTVEPVVDGVVDTHSGEVLTPAALAERLAGPGADIRLILFGEQHTSMDVHRAQLRLLEELERTGRPLLIGLEMFATTGQEGLDRWVDGLLTEEGFLELGGWYEHWGLHWGYYRDLFLFARDHGVPMVGINTPREVVSAVRKEGLEGLSEKERALMPPSLDLEGPGTEDHRTLFRAYMRGDEEDDETIHSSMGEEQVEAMRAAQVTWDAAMAYNAVRALEEAPEGAVMVVLIGSGHVAYGLGAERQARQWMKGGESGVASVIPLAVEDADGERVESVQASYADFLWGLPPVDEPLFPGLGSSSTAADGGRRVIFVPEETMAERAGLRVGDVITAIDGRPVPNREAYNRALARYRWGDAARFTVERDGEEMEVEVIFRRTVDEEDEEEDGDDL